MFPAAFAGANGSRLLNEKREEASASSARGIDKYVRGRRMRRISQIETLTAHHSITCQGRAC
jgi:hypothetical protein